MRVGAVGDLRPDHFDDADRAEVGVLDLVDLAHAAGAEALDDAVLAVDRLIGVAALKFGDRLAAMRAGFVVPVDLSVAAGTLERHGSPDIIAFDMLSTPMALFSSKDPVPQKPAPRTDPQPMPGGTHFGPQITIEGTVTGSERVLIEGTVKGKI